MALNTDNRQIIGYDTVFNLDRATPGFANVTGTIFDYNPHNYANMDSSGYIKVDLGEATDVNYFALRGFYESGAADAILSGSNDDSTYTEIGRITLLSADKTHFIMLDQTESYRYYQLSVSASSETYISVCYAGMALELPNPAGVGHSLPTYDDQTRYMSNTSVNGGFLGLTVKPAFHQAKIEIKYATKAWIDNSYPYLTAAMQNRPVFYAWNYDQASSEVLFCWPKSKLSAPRYTHNTLLSASLAVEGIV